jgi:hypothetical protein
VTTTSSSSNSGESSARLFDEHVDGGAGDVARADGVGQGLLVDDAAAGHVDDADAGLGLGQQLLADEADGLGRLGQVQRDEVGPGHQLVEADQLDRSCAGPPPRDTKGS